MPRPLAIPVTLLGLAACGPEGALPPTETPTSFEADLDVRFVSDGLLAELGPADEGDPEAVQLEVVGLQVRHAGAARVARPCEARSARDASIWIEPTWMDLPLETASLDLLTPARPARPLVEASLPHGIVTGVRLLVGEAPGPRIRRADGAIELLDLDEADAGVLEQDVCVPLVAGERARLAVDPLRDARLVRGDGGRWHLVRDADDSGLDTAP